MSRGAGDGKKTLLPEFLPAPGPNTTLPPKERVAARAQVLLERFRGLGTAAGAAVLGLQCSGYSVVDPLPPPPQQCATLADPFPQIQVQAFFGSASTAEAAQIVLAFTTPRFPSYVGFRIDAVRLTDGVLVRINDKSSEDRGGGTRLEVAIMPTPDATQLLVEVDFGCGAATKTRRYRVSYRLPGLPGEMVIVDELLDAPDGGSSVSRP